MVKSTVQRLYKRRKLFLRPEVETLGECREKSFLSNTVGLS